MTDGYKSGYNPSAYFDCKYYLEIYEDIAQHRLNPLLHYVKAGQREGRSPHRFSDTPDALVGFDAEGNLARPNRRMADGRRLTSVSYDRGHFWYSNDDVRNVATPLSGTPPMGPRRILVLAQDFAFRTEAARPISHYLNAMTAAGGHEFTSIEPVPDADAAIVRNEVETHDFVIVNGLEMFRRHAGLAELLIDTGPQKSAVYLCEDEGAFAAFQSEQPERYAAFAQMAPQLNFLCMFKGQERILEERFGATKARLVFSTFQMTDGLAASAAAVTLDPHAPLRIVSHASPSGGDPSLFQAVADLAAAQGLPWTFHLAGWDLAGEEPGDEGGAPSAVQFAGYLDPDQLRGFVAAADVFFPSPGRDALPVVCMEALAARKRIVAPAGTAIAGLIAPIGGCSTYQEREAGVALLALTAAVTGTLDASALAGTVDRLRLGTFVDALNAAIEQFTRSEGAPASPRPVPAAKAAVFVHLHDGARWMEAASHLRDLHPLAHDLRVTVAADLPVEKRAALTAKIQGAFPDAKVLDPGDHDGAVDPLVACLRDIRRADALPDIVLDIRLDATSDSEDARRSGPLLDDTATAPSNVNRILSLFADYPDIGMVLPQGTHDMPAGDTDQAGGAPADGVEAVQVPRPSLRGRVFWARARLLADALEQDVLSAGDPAGNDDTAVPAAVAVERTLVRAVHGAGKRVHDFDQTMPRPLSLLRGAEAGKDIYIIAAGASCDYINPSFFKDKCVIGINRVFIRYECDYVIFKEYAGPVNDQTLLQSAAVPIVAKWDSGNIRQGKRRINHRIFTDPRYHFFDHLENTREVVDLSVISPDSDKIVVSYSTITSAMHVAAYLGARNIILVGHDCGTLDGRGAFRGYYDDATIKISPWKDPDEYRLWLGQIEAQTVAVKERLEAVFGCNVVSLNPFVNFGLEGHVYERSQG